MGPKNGDDEPENGEPEPEPDDPDDFEDYAEEEREKPLPEEDLHP